jgi:hypothetical protein
VWLLSGSTPLLSINVLDALMSSLQLLKVDVLKETIVEFFGKDPKTSKDLSRIVNQFHFKRLMDLLNDSRTLGKIVHGGEQDAANL